MNTFEQRIPRYLNSSPQILFWELDEILIIGAALGIGILYELLPLSVPVALVAAKYFAKMKADHGHGWVLHAAWWAGIPLVTLTIPSTQREFWG